MTARSKQPASHADATSPGASDWVPITFMPNNGPACDPPQRSRDSEVHVFRSTLGTHLFVADGSRVYDIQVPGCDGGVIDSAALAEESWEQIRSPATHARYYIGSEPLTPPPLYSISLNVAQSCNMSCGYCYADEGRFGGAARHMDLGVAFATVDRLIAESSERAPLLLGYIGGEPLLNRRVVHETTRYATRAAHAAGRDIAFSITTNGTLLRPEDARLFAEFPFTVAISVDGDREHNDRLRQMRSGASAYDALCRGLDVLERHGRPRLLSARVTATPDCGELLPILDHLIALGFDDVGFAPVLVSPQPALAFQADDFLALLQRMVRCGEKALSVTMAGRPYPFSNLTTALHEIHRGTHRPYPCGAGAAYLSANAEGSLFACHRLVDEPRFAMGNVQQGSDKQARVNHLARSHVDLMEPCRSCWARYLCGGGCYHEVSRRGRVACDYIRGWLDFCLRAYVELSTTRPEWFTACGRAAIAPHRSIG